MRDDDTIRVLKLYGSWTLYTIKELKDYILKPDLTGENKALRKENEEFMAENKVLKEKLGRHNQYGYVCEDAKSYSEMLHKVETLAKENEELKKALNVMESMRKNIEFFAYRFKIYNSKGDNKNGSKSKTP